MPHHSRPTEKMPGWGTLVRHGKVALLCVSLNAQRGPPLSNNKKKRGQSRNNQLCALFPPLAEVGRRCIVEWPSTRCLNTLYSTYVLFFSSLSLFLSVLSTRLSSRILIPFFLDEWPALHSNCTVKSTLTPDSTTL